MIKRLVIICLFILPVCSKADADTTNVSSPDGRISFKVFQLNKGLGFTVIFNHTPVITNSDLSMSVDNVSVTNDSKIAVVKKYSVHESYPWAGVHSMAVNECNGAHVSIIHENHSYEFELRVYNDGVAFRMIIPDDGKKSREPDEETVFNLPPGTVLWYHDMEMHYEGVHVRKEISEVRSGEWVAPPATFKLPQGYYGSITEANLCNYSGMALQANGSNGLQMRLPQHQRPSYPYRLRYSPEDTLRLMQPAIIEGTITTPWRVIMIGKDLNAMVNCDIVHNLSPAPDSKLFPKGIHTDWIKAGRAVWKYLDGGGDGTPEVMKKFTDEVAALGFQYNILEGFWSKWTDEQLQDLINYSKQKNVGIWLWKHSKSLRDSAERIAFFKHCHDIGIAGLKIDFFDHEAKELIDLYESILKETAQYHLMVDFHGANKPTGRDRTWPNEMSREAVKGMEASKLMDRATHETTIPFTRYLAGPAEYTVLMFGDRRRNTTWAHQVASAAILSAPMLTYACNPENILSNPAVELIKNIPSTWDETIVLPGSEIGELAAYARRKGSTWFIAVMNGVQPKHLDVMLGFLKAGTYKAQTVSDAKDNPAAEVIENKIFKSSDVISLDLVSGGGYMARIVKQ